MPWWLDILLLLAGVSLWGIGSNEPDDVWSLFAKFLAVVAAAVVLLGGRQLPLELAALVFALWLPGAGSKRLRSDLLITDLTPQAQGAGGPGRRRQAAGSRPSIASDPSAGSAQSAGNSPGSRVSSADATSGVSPR